VKRHRRSFWEKLVGEVEAGAAPSVTARRYGVAERTLCWWRSELKRRSRSAGGQRLLPVVVEGPVVAAGGPIEVVLDGAVIRVVPGTDVAYVATLVRALRAAC